MTIPGLSKGFVGKCAEGLIEITEKYNGSIEALPSAHDTSVTFVDYVDAEELFRETLAVDS